MRKAQSFCEKSFCEKAWGQELVSIGARGVESRGTGDLVRGPILGILMLHAEVFGPITLVKLTLMHGPAHDPQNVCFISSHQHKKLGLQCESTTSLRHWFNRSCCSLDCSRPVSMMGAW